MKKLFTCGLAAMLILAVLLSGCGGGTNPTPAPVILFSENFDSYAVGAPVSGDWVRLTGGAVTTTVQEATKALYVTDAQTIYHGAGSGTWTNYSITLRFKPVGAAACVTVFFRVHTGAEPGQCYYLLNLSDETTFALAKNPPTKPGSYVLIPESGTVAYTADAYNDLKITVTAGHIQAFMNNSPSPFLNYTDPGTGDPGTVITDGTIGFGYSSGDYYIDDIVVTAL